MKMLGVAEHTHTSFLFKAQNVLMKYCIDNLMLTAIYIHGAARNAKFDMHCVWL